MNILITELLCFAFIVQKRDKDLQNRNSINKIKETPSFENKNYVMPENKLKKYLANFIETLQKKFDAEDLSFLFNNISSLKLKVLENNKLRSILFPNEAAYYDISKNCIVFGKEKYIEMSIYHELFHMASTVYTKESKFSGFSQSIEKLLNHFGVGFTEGYTDLLANRYFNITIAYDIEAEISKQIENIVGRKVMEKLYLRADLKSLVSELSEYSSLEEINDFINNVDMICLNKFVNKNKVLMSLTANKILGFIYNISMNKLKKDIEKDKISNEILTKNLIEAHLRHLAILFENYGIKCWDSNEIKNLNQVKVKKLNNVKLMSFY